MKRRKDDFLPGIYAMPGGEVDPDESVHDALFREVKEETGLEVRGVKDYLGSVDYESENGERTRVFNYEVEVAGPFEVKLTEHDEYVWAYKKNLSHLSLTDEVFKILSKHWSR